LFSTESSPERQRIAVGNGLFGLKREGARWRWFWFDFPSKRGKVASPPN
jgi:hypothetical protein